MADVNLARAVASHPTPKSVEFTFAPETPF